MMALALSIWGQISYFYILYLIYILWYIYNIDKISSVALTHLVRCCKKGYHDTILKQLVTRTTRFQSIEKWHQIRLTISKDSQNYHLNWPRGGFWSENKCCRRLEIAQSRILWRKMRYWKALHKWYILMKLFSNYTCAPTYSKLWEYLTKYEYKNQLIGTSNVLFYIKKSIINGD